jgi:branched-chain amino acid transport system permease protein
MDTFLTTYGFLIVSMLFAAMLALSLYLPLMAGQLSLATPGFYAVGGYIAAYISTKTLPNTEAAPEWLRGILTAIDTILPSSGAFPISILLVEMLVAGVLCMILAIIVGVPALRLRGIYLALATIAFVEILRVLSITLEDITGGATGIFGIPQPFSSQIAYAGIALPMLFVTMFFVYRLERIRVGRAFIALREDELAASAIGIDPTRFKLLAFTLGAIIAGVVGAVSAHFINTWNPRQGTFDNSILYLAFVLVGGSRTFVGPVLGAFVLTALPEVLRNVANMDGLAPWIASFLKDGRLIIFGVLIAVGAMFFPQGLISPDLWRSRRRKKTSSPEKTLTPAETRQ